MKIILFGTLLTLDLHSLFVMFVLNSFSLKALADLFWGAWGGALPPTMKTKGVSSSHFLPKALACDLGLVKQVLLCRILSTVVCRLTVGIHSEKRILRCSRHCANVIECTYTNLNGTAYTHLGWMEYCHRSYSVLLTKTSLRDCIEEIMWRYRRWEVFVAMVEEQEYRCGEMGVLGQWRQEDSSEWPVVVVPVVMVLFWWHDLSGIWPPNFSWFLAGFQSWASPSLWGSMPFQRLFFLLQLAQVILYYLNQEPWLVQRSWCWEMLAGNRTLGEGWEGNLLPDHLGLSTVNILLL